MKTEDLNHEERAKYWFSMYAEYFEKYGAIENIECELDRLNERAEKAEAEVKELERKLKDAEDFINSEDIYDDYQEEVLGLPLQEMEQ